MITFDIIIFISSIIFGIALYWLEAKNNGLYRSINKITNSKELRMPAISKKGFFVNQEFIPRLIYVNVIFILVVLVFLVLPFGPRIEYYVSGVLGTMIGIYIANFVINVKDRSENILDKVVDTGNDIIDDIKTKGQEVTDSFSKEETTEETMSTEPETPKKSGRERLKDKGLLK
ncbi:hypothetical protein IMCC3317_20740 [Kordia antarctica]|uniref:Uncharacterized protein n=1 Tax=Kordia antarctica TaxID=1218801 RepID=A0A7L4ZJW6_9FLAO|nr:hypothetical protein [Kordia antarctica]QHI36709.1 hypothetical protein IMCC3317_20740 [Kordia antarctica]